MKYIISIIAATLLLSTSMVSAASFNKFFEDGKEVCVTGKVITDRAEVFKAVYPNLHPMVIEDAVIEEHNHAEKIMAAINTVLDKGHQIHATHFMQLHSDASIMILYGDKPDTFCDFVSLSIPEKEKIEMILHTVEATSPGPTL